MIGGIPKQQVSEGRVEPMQGAKPELESSVCDDFGSAGDSSALTKRSTDHRELAIYLKFLAFAYLECSRLVAFAPE
jgi:hypothetical protein